jgi:hypothetical protein
VKYEAIPRPILGLLALAGPGPGSGGVPPDAACDEDGRVKGALVAPAPALAPEDAPAPTLAPPPRRAAALLADDAAAARDAAEGGDVIATFAALYTTGTGGAFGPKPTVVTPWEGELREPPRPRPGPGLLECGAAPAPAILRVPGGVALRCAAAVPDPLDVVVAVGAEAEEDMTTSAGAWGVDADWRSDPLAAALDSAAAPGPSPAKLPCEKFCGPDELAPAPAPPPPAAVDVEVAVVVPGLLVPCWLSPLARFREVPSLLSASWSKRWGCSGLRRGLFRESSKPVAEAPAPAPAPDPSISPRVSVPAPAPA